ncbi:MAG: PKD domain-containing protein, partial [Calditrichaeota bacterium]|nr:PKD domain-containing protein [Calditrichota bacterium]
MKRSAFLGKLFFCLSFMLSGYSQTKTNPVTSQSISLEKSITNRKSADDIKVLILATSSDITSTPADFNANLTGIVSTGYNMGSATPTVAYLETFDVVMMFPNGNAANPQALGDTLYQYIMNGGNFVAGTFFWQINSWGTNLNSIMPLNGNSSCAYAPGLLDSIISHPLTDGLSTLSISQYRGGNRTLNNGGVPVAWWDDGNILMAYNQPAGRITAVTIFPAHMYYGGVSGDWYQLWQNVFEWTAVHSVTAKFSENKKEGFVPLTIQFTDASDATDSTTITSWDWDFDNDGITDSTSQNPSWTYNSIGVYSVRLIVSDGIDADTILKSNYIRVRGNPEISINPQSYSLTLAWGDTSTQNLQISNSGNDILDYQIALLSNPPNQKVPLEKFLAAYNNSVPKANNDGVVKLNKTQAKFAPGDFTLLNNTPIYVTAFTEDPSTGLMYAQENSGTAYYQYNPEMDEWTQLANSPLNSGNNGGAVYLDGKIYVNYTNNSTMAIYDIAGDQWTTIGGSVQTGSIGTDGTYIYVVGESEFKRFNPVNEEWTPLPVSGDPSGTEKWGGLRYHAGYLYHHSGNGNSYFERFNIASNLWEELPAINGDAVLGATIIGNTYYTVGDYGGTNLYGYDLGK